MKTQYLDPANYVNGDPDLVTEAERNNIAHEVHLDLRNSYDYELYLCNKSNLKKEGE